jgi:flavin-dependent dehydrogenase
VVSSSGSEILIDAKTEKAVVVDRGILDREMAKRAADTGAEFLVKTTACGIRGTTLLTRGVHGHQEIPFRLLIAADGPRSSVARMFNMPRARTYLAGIQADLVHECDSQFVEIYPDASPDFFGWMIPSGERRVRIGLCSQTGVPELFSAFRKRFGENSMHLVTGTLPLGLMREPWSPYLFTGDAAGSQNPLPEGEYIQESVQPGMQLRSLLPVANLTFSQMMYLQTMNAGGKKTSAMNLILGSVCFSCAGKYLLPRWIH